MGERPKDAVLNVSLVLPQEEDLNNVEGWTAHEMVRFDLSGIKI